eukprot:219941-Karenia_brevis.AAC.1
MMMLIMICLGQHIPGLSGTRAPRGRTVPDFHFSSRVSGHWSASCPTSFFRLGAKMHWVQDCQTWVFSMPKSECSAREVGFSTPQ